MNQHSSSSTTTRPTTTSPSVEPKDTDTECTTEVNTDSTETSSCNNIPQNVDIHGSEELIHFMTMIKSKGNQLNICIEMFPDLKKLLKGLKILKTSAASAKNTGLKYRLLKIINKLQNHIEYIVT